MRVIYLLNQNAVGFHLYIPLQSINSSVTRFIYYQLRPFLLQRLCRSQHMHQCTYDAPKMGTANTHGLQSWTPFLLMMKASKRTETPENKNYQKLQIGHMEAEKTMVHQLLCCGSGIRNPDSVHRKMLLLYACPSLSNWATWPQQTADMATAVAEWLQTLPLMTDESQIIRKCEHSHAIISNKCLDFNTSHSPLLHSYTEKKTVWKDSTPNFSVRSSSALFCPLYSVLYSLLL